MSDRDADVSGFEHRCFIAGGNCGDGSDEKGESDEELHSEGCADEIGRLN